MTDTPASPLPVNRRGFLESSARHAVRVAAGVGVAAGAAQAATQDLAGLLNDQPVGVAVVGLRQRGHQLATELARLSACRIVSVCDLDLALAQRTAAAVQAARSDSPAPLTTQSLTDCLRDPAVEAVLIATPDHWHFLHAAAVLNSGKDLYLEPPVTHTLGESRELTELAQTTGRVIQVGLQQRSGDHFQSAVQFLRDGKLGPVHLAKAWAVHQRKGIGRGATQSPPTGLDYEQWLGPATHRPFQPNRFHHHWRWFWDYGSGELGNWGVHLLDVAAWGLGVGLPWQVSAAGGRYTIHDDQETPDTLQVTYSYPQQTIVWEHRQWSSQAPEGRSAAVSFHGELGTLIVDRGGWKVYGQAGQVSQPQNEPTQAHLLDFLQAVRTRRPPVAALETALVSSTLCHLGNAAYRLGRPLHFDPASGQCIRDPEANRLLT